MRNLKDIRRILSFLIDSNHLLTVFRNYKICYSYNVYSHEKLIKCFSTLSSGRQKFLYFDCQKPLARNITLSSILAKNKDKPKEKKKPKKMHIDLNEISEVIDADELSKQMNCAVEAMKNDFIKNLSIRSTTGSLEELPVLFEGKEYVIQELAQVSRKPKLIVLNFSAFPQAIPDVLKSIQESGLNINPQQDGTTLFLPIPKVTKEHRENLAKNAKAIFVRYRDEMRDIRNKSIKKLKHEKISADLAWRVQTNIDLLYEKYVKTAEDILHNKQSELLGTS